MSTTIKCPQCNAVLRLPSGAEGRRLRCPECSTRFRAGGSDPALPGRGRGPDRDGAGPSSTILATPASSQGDVPVVAGSLRETFSLPLMQDDAGPARGPRISDAASLFHDDPPPSRRPAGAAARALRRGCPSCGNTVPAGMSLCPVCGIDVETGQRVEEVPVAFDGPMRAQRRSEMMPLGVAVVGGGLVMVSGILALVALSQAFQGRIIAAILCGLALLGVYSSVQFLRGRSLRLLLVVLALGALVDLAGLIALPVYQANTELPAASAQADPEIDDPEVPVPGLIDRLDLRRITCGIVVLMIYAALCLYLLSPGVRRYVRRA